ncbi:MAG: EF-P beta-lysylation protein EpmB [Fibrobacteria bacterium]|nr:EF-P beta-lysylation protein EpmB [Fibrobacteria bacterium]
MEPQEILSWTEEVRRAFRDPRELAGHLGLRLTDLPKLPEKPGFPFLVPRPFVARIKPGDAFDPLLLQVWPDFKESQPLVSEKDDPVGDGRALRGAGLLQKYRGRVLLVTSGACAINCRYCFRQKYAYEDGPRSEQEWEEGFTDLERDPNIREAILSGGDPLTRTDSVIRRWVDRIASTPHVRTLRIHTRLPIVIPSRVTDDLCEILSATRLQVVVVVHCNHPAELDPSTRASLAKLRKSGINVLNQSVLLRRINDDADLLEGLSLMLWDAGVLPYYLHALDPVSGSSRFSVPDEKGIQLIDQLRRRLPGYLVPRFVREMIGEPSKTVLA